jgi:hypothetical protein
LSSSSAAAYREVAPPPPLLTKVGWKEMAANPWDGAKAAFPKAGRRGRNELAIAVGSICRWQLLVVFGEARAERGWCTEALFYKGMLVFLLVPVGSGLCSNLKHLFLIYG